jgi:tRNA pseudouridine55 synthase
VNFPPGVLLVEKPVGPTSHDVVAHIRKAAGTKKVGHAGTLDPFASGLLILLVGQATRLSEYILGLDKVYHATAVLGLETSTDDPEGEVVRRDQGWTQLTAGQVESTLAGFRGTSLQVPPVYSSKKVAGVAAHRRVRRGEVLEMKPEEVRIHEIQLLDYSPPEVHFRVACSSGTYIRALGRDLGRDLGVGAHLSALTRTAVGNFELEVASALSSLRDREAILERLLSPSDALSHLPSLDVDSADGRRIRHGQAVPLGRADLPEDEPVRILLDGKLLAVGFREGDDVRPRKVLVHD